MPLPVRNSLVGVPSDVAYLYSFHERQRRYRGMQPDSILQWARDRAGIKGFEAVTAWVDRMDHDQRARQRR